MIVIVLISLILITALIYFFIILHYTSKSKFAKALEFFFIGCGIFILPGVTLFPFNKLHPRALAGFDKTLPSTLAQLSIYIGIIFILNTRFRQNFSNFLFKLQILFLKNPFLCFLIFFTLLSPLWSETPITTLRSSLVLLGISTFATYVGSQYTWEELFKLLRWTSATTMIFSTVVAVAIPSAGRNGKGWGGILGHPTNLGPFAALSVNLWILCWIKYPKRRWLSFFLISLSSLVMIFTNSGSSLIICASTLTLISIIFLVKRLPYKLTFPILILFLTFITFLSLFLSEISSLLISSLGKDVTLTGRTEFWPQLIQAIEKRPFLGYGYTSFWQPWRGANNPAISVFNPNGYIPPHAHNGFLDLCLSLGTIGLTAFFTSLLQNIHLVIKQLHHRNIVQATLPFMLLTFVIIKNIAETGLWELKIDPFIYVLITIRLSIDLNVNNFKKENKLYAFSI